MLVPTSTVAPTLLDAANIDAPEVHKEFQGVSFYPDADTEPCEYAIAKYIAPQPPMGALEKRVGDLPDHIYEYDRSLRAIRSEEYKLIRGSDGNRELYHVATDPEEQHDIVDEKLDTVADLETYLDKWLDSFDHTDTSELVSIHSPQNID